MDARQAAQVAMDHESCGEGLQYQSGLGLVCMGCRAVIEDSPAPVNEAGEPVPGADPVLARIPQLDLTRPLTPDEAGNHIAECVLRLEQGAVFHRVCIEEAFEADRVYQLAYARALVHAKGASDQRRAVALLECEAEYTAKTIAEMKVKAVAATMHDLRSALSGYQSMSRTVNVTYQGAGQAYGNS